jgi:hypothetical protein
LGHRFADQAPGRKTCEGGEPGQREGGIEGTARDDQGSAPVTAHVRLKTRLFANSKPELWQWRAIGGLRNCGVNFA